MLRASRDDVQCLYGDSGVLRLPMRQSGRFNSNRRSITA